MPSETHVRVGGIWRKIPTNGIYVRDDAVWNQVDYAYVKAGGVWQTVYVRDNTGPSAPSGVTATWSKTGSTPSLLIQWTNPPDADYDYMQIAVIPSGQPPLPAFNVSKANQSVHYTSYIINNSIYSVTLTPYDINGNPGVDVTVSSNAWSGVARGRSPSPLTIDPIDSGTFRNGAWRTDSGVQPSNRRVYQGTTASGTNYGVFLYGDQIIDRLAGGTINSASFSYFRVNSGGPSGPVAPELWFSPHITSKAVSPEAVGIFEGPKAALGVAINGSTNPYYTQLMHGSWYDNLVTGISAGTIRAIVMYSLDQTVTGSGYSNSYAQFYGAGEAPGSVVPGRIMVDHNG